MKLSSNSFYYFLGGVVTMQFKFAPTTPNFLTLIASIASWDIKVAAFNPEEDWGQTKPRRKLTHTATSNIGLRPSLLYLRLEIQTLYNSILVFLQLDKRLEVPAKSRGLQRLSCRFGLRCECSRAFSRWSTSSRAIFSSLIHSLS